MDDPVELLFVILFSFHAFVNKAKSLKYVNEIPCLPLCPSHALFWINILEQKVN